MRRREFIVLSGFAAFGTRLPAAPADERSDPSHLAQRVAEIEQRVGGRLGVAMYDAATRRRAGYRTRERFPMCSTFKVVLAAEVLTRVDSSREQLERVVPYDSSDLLEYAPVTRAHVGDGGMTVSALMEAALEYSDNTAANLLLATVGGPPAVTRYLRSLGDEVTRLDRIEPALNSADPGDARDTTTPEAMLVDLDQILLGKRLAPSSRARLLGWLQANTTGREKLRAGMPSDWRVGDKTGSGGHGATNDVAIAWPAERAPVLVAAYLVETEADITERNQALAGIGRLVSEWVAAGAPRGR